MPPQSLTPQSLKRKLQQVSSDYPASADEPEEPPTSSDDPRRSESAYQSPPNELFLPSDNVPSSSPNFISKSSPLRMDPTTSSLATAASPTKIVRTSSILHAHISNSQSPTSLAYSPNTFTQSLTPFQNCQLLKLFRSRSPSFPLELLKPAALAEVFLKGRALERYFIRRCEEIQDSKSSKLQTLPRPFVRSSPPSAPLSVYLERLFRYCHPEPLHMLAIVAYSERLIKNHQMYVPPPGWHRFVVAAWMLAAKALLGDQYWTNIYWSRVAGMPVTEIYALETELASILDWRLQIPPDEIRAAWYLVQL